MDTFDISLSAFGAALSIYGALALLATWYFTSWLQSPLFSDFMLTGRLKPTRANRTMMATWSLLFGAYLVLSIAELRPLSYIAFALWAPVALAVLIVKIRGGRES